MAVTGRLLRRLLARLAQAVRFRQVSNAEELLVADRGGHRRTRYVDYVRWHAEASYRRARGASLAPL
jgi:hypothetical protein